MKVKILACVLAFLISSGVASATYRTAISATKYSASSWCSTNSGSFFANVTTTTVTFDTNIFVNNSVWASGTNSRLTATVAGTYLIRANVHSYACSGDTLRYCLFKNGSFVGYGCALNATIDKNASAGPMGNPTWIVFANAGDYYEVKVYQATGLAVGMNGTNTVGRVGAAMVLLPSQ